jgi:iron complex transport system permease protein
MSTKNAALLPVPAYLFALLGIVAIFMAAFAFGKYPISIVDLLRSIFARLTGADAELPEAIEIVIWNIRLPRIVAGMLIGAALAAAGAAYQNMFRNPLVSPDILGVSAGAGFGATIGIFFGLPLTVIQVLAFVCGLAAVGVVYGVSGLVRRHDPVLVLVLAGIAVGTLLNAGVSLLKILSDPHSQQLSNIVFWLLGSLNGVNSRDLASAVPLVLIGLVPMILLRWRVNLLSLPDEEAAALGIEVARLRMVLIIAATLVTATVVSIAGIVGWVGLVVPHAARFLVGPNFSRLLPASLLLGAGFVVGTDILARTLVVIELPLGIVTAMVGAPFFLYLLAHTGKTE